MIHIQTFTFNPFYENTYVLYDDTKECVIIDPGCVGKEEEQRLDNYILENRLKPVHLLNTHCHIDHIYGNHYVSEKYGLPLKAHRLEKENILYSELASDLYGVEKPERQEIGQFIEEGDLITFGESTLKVVFTPGHTAGHVVFLTSDGKSVIGGDVLFRESVGRTDLPGGSSQTLTNSIRSKLFPLPDETTVYPGHGPSTTIGYERENNPFL